LKVNKFLPFWPDFNAHFWKILLVKIYTFFGNGPKCRFSIKNKNQKSFLSAKAGESIENIINKGSEISFLTLSEKTQD